MIKKFREKTFNVYVDLPDVIEYYKFSLRRKKFKLISKDIFLKDEIPSVENLYISKFVENIDIQSEDIPFAASEKFVDITIKKKLAEKLEADYSNYTVRYSITARDRQFKTLNIYYFNKQNFSIYEHISIDVSMFTYIPFSLLSFSREFKDKKVMHIYIYKGYIFSIYSINDSLLFYRVITTSNFDEIYENVVLTYRYINTSFDNIDIILMSGSIYYEGYQPINRVYDEYQLSSKIHDNIKAPIARINPYFYFDHQSDDIFQVLDYILPIGTIKASQDYNFIPEETQLDKNFYSILKLSSVILSLVLILISINVYNNMLNLLDKYNYVKSKSNTVNALINNLLEKVKDKDIDGIIIKNQFDNQIYLQTKSLNTIKDHKDKLTNQNSKVELRRTEKGYMIVITYTKSFDSPKEVEKYVASLNRVNNVQIKKDLDKKSIEVLISYETVNTKN